MTRRRGFTLTELIIAVAILVGVLLAVGKIFSTTGKVTGLGEANADVLQEVAAIARRMRSDLANLSSDGVFVIKCVEVPNDLNPGSLINPALPATAFVRADQLVFFANAVEGVSTFRTGNNASVRGETTESRIYYGHAFQIAGAGLAASLQGNGFGAIDMAPAADVFPWSNGGYDGPVAAVRTRMETPGYVYEPSPSGEISVPYTEARRWIFARQAVALLDDDMGPPAGNNKTVYLGEVPTARSVFLTDPQVLDDTGRLTPQIRDGRLDAAATQLTTIRQRLQYFPDGTPREWFDNPGQRELIADELVYYPRAERVAPSMHRIDQALTNHVLGTAVSSVRIEWTYREGTGARLGFFSQSTGNEFDGVDMFPPGIGILDEQRWFGMPNLDLDVTTFDAFQDDVDDTETIFADNIERLDASGPVRVYDAVFGFNRNQPLVDTDDDGDVEPFEPLAYTPWPTAIRVTLTVHDPATNLENGRQVQFIIDLPRRKN